MALRIRLQRGGKTHNPVYRIVVAEALSRRDGRFVESLGTYAPKARGKDRELLLKLERAEYWLSVGAKPSDTVRSLIKKARRMSPEDLIPAAPTPKPVSVEAPAPAPAAAAPAPVAAATATAEAPVTPAPAAEATETPAS